MKYLFFDIECANCFEGTGKICEFGYILTDEKFNVLEEDSLKINPCSPFDKKGFAIRGIKLEEPFEYYKTQPNFKVFYDRIKTLLQQPHQIVVGHGVGSDAKYLLDECNRYKLQPINFEFVDTCELAKLIFKREKGLKLKEVYADFCEVEDVVQNHRSLEDAYMTLEIAKFYSRKLEMAFYQIITNYSFSSGESYLGRIIKAGAPDLNYSRGDALTKKNKDLIHTFIEQEIGYNSETKYVLSKEFLKNNFPATIVILNRLRERKELFAFEMSYDCIYVLNDGENCKLDKYISYSKERGREPNIRKVSFDSFLTSIGLTSQDLKITPQQLDELIGNMKCNKKWYDSYKRTHSLFYKINSTLQDEEFECSVDFPVIQYVANMHIEIGGVEKQIKFFLFYDYVMDEFFNLHPYRVNRGENSYLSENFFKKAKENSANRIQMELARQFKMPQGGKLKGIKIEHEYPYITSYKFKGKFEKDTLTFDFPAQILADDDFKNSAKVDISNISIHIEKCIKELYNEKTFAVALCNMAKFKFGYKDKTFIAPKVLNKKYNVGDQLFLPKEYYRLTTENALEDCHIPSLIEVKTDLFKKKLQLPVLIRRTNKK